MTIQFIEPLPQTQDMFYATNNPYQLSGPRGFTEFKLVEETTQMFARIDFPGVIKESVKMSVGSSKKAVFVSGKAPKELEHDVSFREFETAVGLSCECCKIINVEGYLADGVLRLIISKEMINFRVGSSCADRATTSDGASSSLVTGGHPLAYLRGLRPQGRQGRHGTDPLNRAFTGPIIVLHPFVLEGSKSAYESKQFLDGGLFFRIDMPGVPHDRFTVTMENDGCITVTGQAPKAMYDSSGREYKGKVAIVPRDYDSRLIEKVTKHGVIRLIIPSI